MATNVTQKDKTLHEIIAWADLYRKSASALSRFFADNCDGDAVWAEDGVWHDGRMTAFDDVITHCESMLGYSGTTPLEVENQSKDTPSQ